MLSIFRSIKFNVILFVIIATLAAIGTLIPQVTDNADKVTAFIALHPHWGGLFQSFGFYDVYHTFTFSGLLALMAFDIVVCKLANKPPDPGLVPLLQNEDDERELTMKVMKKKPFRLDGRLDGTIASVGQSLQRSLKKRHYRVKKMALSDGGIALIASRHRLQRWGSYVSHISLVVILMGAMIRSLFGFETFLPILEGRSANVVAPLLADLDPAPPLPPDASLWRHVLSVLNGPVELKKALRRTSVDPLRAWTLSVDQMIVDFYKNSTTPSTFASKVRLYDEGQPLAQQTLRVNQPMDIHHIRFYQASWGVTGMIQTVKLQVGAQTLDLGMKGTFKIPNQPWTGRIEHYLPDFTIGPDGNPSTASLEWKNPALIVGFYNGKDERIATLALGAPSPVTVPGAAPWALFFVAGGHLPVPPPFQVISVSPLLFSGVQVTYDPGFPFIVVGVLSMIAGLMALFYLHQRRVLIFLKPDADQVRVDIGAWSSRGASESETEFRSIFHSIKLLPL